LDSEHLSRSNNASLRLQAFDGIKIRRDSHALLRRAILAGTLEFGRHRWLPPNAPTLT
jgi:hypothetical protein